MTTLQLLHAARAKIQLGWCQGQMAKNASGSAEFPRSERACSWCIVGAIKAAKPDELLASNWLEHHALEYLGKVFGLGCFAGAWNDTAGRTQADALDFYDRAIVIASGDKLAVEEEALARQVVK